MSVLYFLVLIYLNRHIIIPSIMVAHAIDFLEILILTALDKEIY
jgi:hypothetical protein